MSASLEGKNEELRRLVEGKVDVANRVGESRNEKRQQSRDNTNIEEIEELLQSLN